MKAKFILKISFILTLIYNCTINGQTSLLMGVNNWGGNGIGGTIYTIPFSGVGYSNVNNFVVDVPGQTPNYSKLCNTTGSKMYGVAPNMGLYNSGVMYSYDPTVNTYTVLHHFSGTDGTNPNGGLLLASDGQYYGTATNGGTNLRGTIYRYNDATATFSVVFTFPNTLAGQNPYCKLMQATNGLLYGMTSAGGANNMGVLFSFDIATNTYTKLYDMTSANGSLPYGSLVEYAGSLYGMTSLGGANNVGAIFQYNYSTATYTLKHSFISAIEGANPSGTMIKAANNKLYGLTSAGGSNGIGTIFEYVTTTNIFTVKYNFVTASGANPYGDLELSTNGKYYGLAQNGGLNTYGVVFQYDYLANSYTKVSDMTLSTGHFPVGSLTQNANGKMYGLSKAGGNTQNYQVGDIFEFDPSPNTTVQKKIFEYSANGKYSRNSTLILASDGFYYGTTEYGGINNAGVLYRFDLTTGTYTKLRDFIKSTGSHPRGPLLQASNGKLYGTCYDDGIYINGGVLFSYDLSTSTYAVLFNFLSNTHPAYGVMQASNGKLYGTNQFYLFSYDIGTSTETNILNISAGESTPIEGNNTTLYGVSYWGGAYNFGAIWKYNITTSVGSSSVYSFTNTGSNGYNPVGSLAIGSNGNLFGLTNKVASGSGTFYEYDYVNNIFNVRHTFNGTVGSQPVYNSPFLASDGNIYCSSIGGGTKNVGTIFKWNYSAITKIHDFSETSGYWPTGSFVEITCTTLTQPAAITGNTTLCQSSINSYSVPPVAGATSYNWILPSGWAGSSSTNTISTTSSASSGTISVTANNACGASTPRTLTVTVTNIPVTPGAISGSTSICAGTGSTNYSVALVGGATSYSWSLPGGWSGSSSTNTVLATPGSSGVFSVTASNACGTSSQQTLNIVVSPSPTITVNSGTICSGQSFTIIPTGASTYTYSSGGAVVSPTTTSSYSVTGTSSGGCVGSNTAIANISVNSIPVANASTSQTITCTNPTVTLNGSGVTTYTWSGPGIVSGGNSATPIVNIAGTYSLIGSSGTCLSNIATVLLTSNTAPPSVSITVSSNSICLGNSATLIANGASTYSWSTGSSTATIAVSPTTTTLYVLTGTNTVNGCSNSINQSITVNPLPVVNANTNNTLICGPPFQGTSTLTAAGATTYMWNTAATTTAIAVSPSVTTNYTVTGTDANGCVNSSIITQSVSTCTGLNQITFTMNEINVYPNPFNDKVTIITNGEKQNVHVFNVLGSLVYTSIIENEKTEIDLRDQTSGIYFVRVGSITKKIIKQ